MAAQPQAFTLKVPKQAIAGEGDLDHEHRPQPLPRRQPVARLSRVHLVPEPARTVKFNPMPGAPWANLRRVH
jgi:hypothetical protein